MKGPKIIESYQVPKGNVSPDIFKLPCVIGATKLSDGNTEYTCAIDLSYEYANVGDYICKSDDNRWFTLSAEEYHEFNLNDL